MHYIIVVTAIIAVARSLGLRVVAEGVENLLQMTSLNRMGCTVMQGFLISRPHPPEEIERWIHEVVLPKKAPWIGIVGEEVGDELSALPASRLPQAV